MVPKKYWDLYPIDEIELADSPHLPTGAPSFAGIGSAELRSYHGIPRSGPVVGEDQARTLTAGCYACISYIDALVGRLLDAIDRLGLREKTVIVLWSDHGFHLGKNGMWCKQTPTLSWRRGRC